LSVLNPDINQNLLNELNPNIILVALNISRGDIQEPLANFHDKRSEATDYKLRYALKDTALWGGYLTDIIKDFDQKISGKVVSFLKENPRFEKENVDYFLEEISYLGVTTRSHLLTNNINILVNFYIFNGLRHQCRNYLRFN